jgi:exopolysaccharide biosynthesis protein
LKNNFKFFIIYSITIFIIFIYILLKIFVIPVEGVKVSNTSNTSSENNIENLSITTNTSTSYEDDNIKINITTLRQYDTNIYVADISLSNISYLQTAFANNTYGRNIKETTSDMANNHNAILAINGDYYGFRTSGFVLRNGVIYRNTSYNNEDLVINSDGTFEIINENTTNLSNLLNNGALQVFSFGPALINNSTISVSTNEEVDQSMSSNPRTAIGEISPLHYVFVVSDGRTSASSGLTLYELATVMKNLGCTIAYNLDGGGSSTMYFNGNIINNPTDGHSSGERKVSDIIYVGY